MQTGSSRISALPSRRLRSRGRRARRTSIRSRMRTRPMKRAVWWRGMCGSRWWLCRLGADGLKRIALCWSYVLEAGKERNSKPRGNSFKLLAVSPGSRPLLAIPNRLSHTSWKRQVCTSESYTTPSLHSRLAAVKRRQRGKAGEKARLAHASNTALHQSSPTLLYSAADAVG